LLFVRAGQTAEAAQSFVLLNPAQAQAGPFSSLRFPR